MRILAIGDIHGCLRAFDTLLDLVAPRRGDLVVTLGDYIDRGPDSATVLDRLIALRSNCRHVALLGNHDLMMLDSRDNLMAFEDWQRCGGKHTLKSYDADTNWARFADAIPVEHWRFLGDRCVPYFEIDTHFFVHANAYADHALDEQPEYMLHWTSLEVERSRPHESGKIMICGHTAQRCGRPLSLGHAVCIDTWVYGEFGWLTCLDVRSGKYWQANQRGLTQIGWLEAD